MNILQIMGCTSIQYGSMEKYLLEKGKYCNKHKHNFIIIYDNLPESDEFRKDIISNNIELLVKKLNNPLDIKYYHWLYKIFKKYKIDIIHCYFAPTRHYAIFFSWLIGVKKRFRQAANLPLHGFRRNSNLNSIKFYRFKLIHRILSLFANKYICRSKSVKQEYIKIGLKSDKLKIADGGTDIEKYKKLKNININQYPNKNLNNFKIMIGTASRIVKTKGINVIIQSVRILKTKGIDIILLIAGTGPEKDKLLKMIKDYNLENRVYFLGHKKDLIIFYNIIDIYISSSYSEGMSNSVLEAMACETPVILSNIDPNMEIVNKAKTMNIEIGYSFSCGDPKDLSRNILTLINNNLRKIGNNSRKVVKNYFSLNSRIEKEINIYKGLI